MPSISIGRPSCRSCRMLGLCDMARAICMCRSMLTFGVQPKAALAQRHLGAGMFRDDDVPRGTGARFVASHAAVFYFHFHPRLLVLAPRTLCAPAGEVKLGAGQGRRRLPMTAPPIAGN